MNFWRCSRLTKTTAQAAVWAVALLFVLGISRFLVVCPMPCCDGQIALFHASCDKCEPERCHACEGEGDACHSPADDGGEKSAGVGCDCCVDVAVHLDLGQPPQKVTVDQPELACWWPATSSAYTNTLSS